jgi:hypothetical protein
MSNSSRPPLTGRDVVRAGAWLRAVNLGCAGFLMGTRFVVERFHDV